LATVPLAYKWFVGILFGFFGSLSVYYFLAARRVDLVVSDEGLVLGGVLRARSLAWDEITRFEILDPSRRTPFRYAFAPWVDQARAVLHDGHAVRLRAVEPWHGFTVLSYIAALRYTAADRTVDALNALLRSRTARQSKL